jgi:hypothetical protein
MKLYYEGEKGRAICSRDGAQSFTFARRSVPFSDGDGMVSNILVGVCDRCGDVVAMPPQSTPAIKAAREKATASIEANLPAVYVDALDLACYRIDPQASQDFRKRLLMYYVVRMWEDKKWAKEVRNNLVELDAAFRAGEASGARRRLSMKLTPSLSHRVDGLMEMTKLSRTDLFKSLVIQIERDIVRPAKPADLSKLKTLAAIAVG